MNILIRNLTVGNHSHKPNWDVIPLLGIFRMSSSSPVFQSLANPNPSPWSTVLSLF